MSSRTSTCDIFYIVGQLGAGGLERQLWLLLGTLDRTTYRPGIFVWNGKGDDLYRSRFQRLGVPVFGYETRRSSSLSRLGACLQIARRLRPSLVHSCSFYTNIAAFLCGQFLRVPSVGSIRGDYHRTLKENGPLLARLSAGWPKHQIVNSRRALEAAIHHKGFLRSRSLHLVRNGIDLHEFTCFKDERSAEVVILGVGSLLPVKRWDRLIRAASVLRDKGIHFRVVIVGEGPTRPALEEMIRERRLEGIVELKGFAQDIPWLMRGASFLVHTSESEGCPNAILEAMACALPVVATDSGDIPELVEEGITGFTIPNGEETVLAARISQLIESSNLRASMGRKARQKAEREFGLDGLVRETLDVYRQAGWERAPALDQGRIEPFGAAAGGRSL